MYKSKVYKPINIGKTKCTINNQVLKIELDQNYKTLNIPSYMSVTIKDSTMFIDSNSDEKLDKYQRAMFGTTIRLISNAIIGLTEGFKRLVYLKGIGYKASVKDNILTLNIGYSHPVHLNIPTDVKVEVEDSRRVAGAPGDVKITLSSDCKQKNGDFAEKIRIKRKYDPCVGNGVIILGKTVVKRKSGAKK